MLLSKILTGVVNIDTILKDGEINKIEFDSRKVAESDVFVATTGTAVDGHKYIETAIEAGASVIVCQKMPENRAKNVEYICVDDSAEALGVMSSNFYNNPSHALTLVGITGTNGKTTTATLLYDLFRKLGYKVGLISTVCNYVHDRAIEATHTTPDAIALNALLGDMVSEGCEYAFMEVSSHAMEQRRIAGVQFAGGVFSNLTRDHLDYHLSFDNYLKAKKRFFDDMPKGAFVLSNSDDKNGMVMMQNTKATKQTYSVRGLADYTVRILEESFDGMLMNFCGREAFMPFVGRFNAYNLLAVYATATLLGADADEVLRIISTLKPVSGRFDAIKSPTGYTAVVDYAHTPDALTNVIDTINEVRNVGSTLITVVGCGGNRDAGKRPIMAQEAVKGSNKVILTSDNPRFENPQTILDDMVAGLNERQMRDVLVIADRRMAIRTACQLAKKDDVILIAGKGHEDYQIIEGVKHHFDDKEEVIAMFNL